MTSIRHGRVPTEAEVANLTRRYDAIGQWSNVELQTMAERQAHQIAQENAKKEKKIKSVETEITNLISFNKKRQAYA